MSLLHLPPLGPAEPPRIVRIMPLSPVPGGAPDPEASIETGPTPIVRMAPIVRGGDLPAKRTVAFGRFSAVSPGAVEPPTTPVPGAASLAGLARERDPRPAAARERAQLRTGGTIALNRARGAGGALGRIAELLLPRPALQRAGGARGGSRQHPNRID